MIMKAKIINIDKYRKEKYRKSLDEWLKKQKKFKKVLLSEILEEKIDYKPNL